MPTFHYASETFVFDEHANLTVQVADLGEGRHEFVMIDISATFAGSHPHDWMIKHFPDKLKVPLKRRRAVLRLHTLPIDGVSNYLDYMQELGHNVSKTAAWWQKNLAVRFGNLNLFPVPKPAVAPNQVAAAGNPDLIVEPELIEELPGTPAPAEIVVGPVEVEIELSPYMIQPGGSEASILPFMTVEAKFTGSPFDAIKRTRSDGTHYWLASELGGSVGYEQSRNIEAVTDRAKISCQGFGLDASEHFADVSKPSRGGNGAVQIVPDCELTRHAAYLWMLEADSRKPLVAAGKNYFALRARQAEKAEEKFKAHVEAEDATETALRVAGESHRRIKSLESFRRDQELLNQARSDEDRKRDERLLRLDLDLNGTPGTMTLSDYLYKECPDDLRHQFVSKKSNIDRVGSLSTLLGKAYESVYGQKVSKRKVYGLKVNDVPIEKLSEFPIEFLHSWRDAHLAGQNFFEDNDIPCLNRLLLPKNSA